MSQEYSYIIGFESIDLSLLPKNSRTPGTDSFRVAVTRLIEDKYKDFGGAVQILVNDKSKTVQVKWLGGSADKSLGYVALEYLKRGDYKKAIPLLDFLERLEPDNPQHFYNHGMALSDL